MKTNLQQLKISLYKNSVRLLGVGGMLFVGVAQTSAYNITSTGVVDKNDFLLDQAKVELKMNPGEQKDTSISFTNRTKTDKSFEIKVEDMSGTTDGKEAIVLLGDKKGEFSGSKFIVPEIQNFTLKPGEKISLNVKVSVPISGEPGGKYASVVFGNKSGEGAGAKTVSRVGALFLVEVIGNVKKEGYLSEFSSNNRFIFDTSNPIKLNTWFKNDGNVHLDPSGKVEVGSVFGNVLEILEIKPFYVLPKSLRNKELFWLPVSSFGIYSMNVEINRGYDDLLDNKNIYVFIMSWKIILGLIVFMLALFLLKKFVFSRLNISYKK